MAETKKKQTKKRGLAMKLALFGFFVIVGFGVGEQYLEYRQLCAQYDSLQVQIAQEQEKSLEYENKKEYYNSDSYIEQVAREKLGLVKSNEILYINRNE